MRDQAFAWLQARSVGDLLTTPETFLFEDVKGRWAYPHILDEGRDLECHYVITDEPTEGGVTWNDQPSGDDLNLQDTTATRT
ncbi:hypothetical protein BRD56_00575 [Thermoplasmatales archaeon SW_10_69_26]|nr:MAG: hypothetical protein BRD56_00575 [Thermoplasmatales archaeon SW_10_69_26]